MNIEQIKEICDRVLVIDHGSVRFDGQPEEAEKYYDDLINSIEQNIKKQKLISGNIKRGFSEINKVTVKNVSLYNFNDEIINNISKGERTIINIILLIDKVISDLQVKILIKKIIR